MQVLLKIPSVVIALAYKAATVKYAEANSFNS